MNKQLVSFKKFLRRFVSTFPGKGLKHFLSFGMSPWQLFPAGYGLIGLLFKTTPYIIRLKVFGWPSRTKYIDCKSFYYTL